MFLWHDAFGTAPPEPPRPTPPELPDITLRSEYLTHIDATADTGSLGNKEASPQQQQPSAAMVANRKRLHDERALSRRIYDTLRPYHEVTLSISTSVAIPPPFPFEKMSRLDNTLHLLREARYEEEARLILREEQKAVLLAKAVVGGRSDDGTPTAVVAQPASLLLNIRPPTPDLFSPTDSSEAGNGGGGQSEQGETPPAIARPVTGRAGPLPPLPSLDSMLHSPRDVAQVSALAQIESEHATQALLWEWYQSKYTHSLLPQDNQGASRPALRPMRDSSLIPLSTLASPPGIFYLSAEGCGEYGHCSPPRLKNVGYLPFSTSPRLAAID
jgi:hypothetical protein